MVIGGKLVIKPEAEIDGSIINAVRLDNSNATTVAALRNDLNALIDALREVGVVASND